MIAGAAVGGLLGFAFGGSNRGQAAKVGAIVFGIIGGGVGGVYGGIEGYQFSRDALTAGDKVTTTFNNESSQKNSATMITSTAKVDTTYVVRPGQDTGKTFVAPIR